MCLSKRRQASRKKEDRLRGADFWGLHTIGRLRQGVSYAFANSLGSDFEAFRMKQEMRLALWLVAAVMGSQLLLSWAGGMQEAKTAATVARKAGTVKSIKGNAITLKPDTGADVNVTVQDGAKVMRIAPGQT